MSQQLLTPAEAAAMLGCTTGTLRGWCRRGVLAEGVHYVHPPGTQRRYLRAALRRWLFTPSGRTRPVLVPDRPTPLNLEALG